MRHSIIQCLNHELREISDKLNLKRARGRRSRYEQEGTKARSKEKLSTPTIHSPPSSHCLLSSPLFCSCTSALVGLTLNRDESMFCSCQDKGVLSSCLMAGWLAHRQIADTAYHEPFRDRLIGATKYGKSENIAGIWRNYQIGIEIIAIGSYIPCRSVSYIMTRYTGYPAP